MCDLDPAAVAAAVDLPGVSPRRAVVDAGNRIGVRHAVQRDRLAGLMARALEAGVVDAPADVAAEFRVDWEDQLVASVAVEGLLLDVAAVLDTSHVRWRLTKGAALAHLDYPDASWRTFGDVDLVIHPLDWARTLEVLAVAGWSRESPELAVGFDHRFGKGATLTQASGLELDLHRRLAVGRFGVLLDMICLFDEPGDVLQLGGRTIPCLSPSARLLHACFHAVLGGFRRLRAFRDVAQLLLVANVPWLVTVEMARQHRVEAVVAAAFNEAWEVLGLEISHPAHAWAAAQRSTILERHALMVFREERSFALQALTALPSLGMRDRGRYAWALVVQPGRRGR